MGEDLVERRVPRRPVRRGDLNGGLSDREMDVLELVAADLTNKMIGGALYLSEDTIKTHLKRIYDKLGVNTRLGAVVAATGRGLIPCHCGLNTAEQPRRRWSDPA